MDRYIISIIIPVLNEAAIVKTTLEKLIVDPNIEIIVVDGGSKDNTPGIARQLGVKTIGVSGGRAAQMNAGAKIANSNILLFLHADTRLPHNFIELILATLKQPRAIAGAFDLAIDGKDKSLRWVERLVEWRSHWFSLPYGDQAIFMTKATFVNHGGFPQMPIMEDFALIQKLKKQGEIAIAPGKVVTSARRWQKLGVWQTTLINQLVIIGYYLGISPTKLRDFYRSRGKKVHR